MIDKPKPYNTALEELQNKVPEGAPYSHKEWVSRGPDVTTKAFFSAGVENVRFLQRMQKLLGDYLSRSVETVINDQGEEVQALKVGSRADFVRKTREFMVKEGMVNPNFFTSGSQTDLQNIASLSRLRLIFDTNVRQAYGFGRYKQGMHPAVLSAFPAARFVRNPGAQVKRPRHEASENEVRLKTDYAYWATFQNAAEIGGFEVPWAPYGFNSFMGQQDVSRKEAIDLGLIQEGDKVVEKGKSSLLDGLKADLDKAPKEAVERLREKLKKRRRLKEAAEAAEEEETEVIEVNPTRNGESLVGKLEPTHQAVKLVLEVTEDTIDKVHGDGPLEAIELRKGNGRGGANASYNPYNGLEHIEVNKFKTPHVSLAHEIGHWLDDMAFRTRPKDFTIQKVRKKGLFAVIRETFGSSTLEFKKFRDAARKSQAIKDIESDGRLPLESREYLLTDHEIFARAYAQWIAVRSNNGTMKREIKSFQDRFARGEIPHVQWMDDDFKAIAKEIDKIFKNRGWLND